MLGLNFLVANQIDQAIDELTKAAQAAGDPLEIHLILGNLYREKGQVGRAIQEHQSLLQRPNLRKLEHANVLLCLGLDYRRGGFVDRAHRGVHRSAAARSAEPLRAVEPREAARGAAPVGRGVRDAAAARGAVDRADGGAESPRHNEILAFLENELGQAALKRMRSTRSGAAVRGRHRARRAATRRRT